MKLIRGIIVMVVFVIAGGFLTVMSIRDKVEFSNRKEFSPMGVKDFHAGQFITGEIHELWDEFAYMEETNTDTKVKKTTKRYFILPLESTMNGDEDDRRFIVAVINNSTDLATARKLVKETDAWYDYDEPITTVMNADGKVTKMGDDVHEKLLDFIEDWGYDDTHIVGYELHIGGNADSSTVLLIIGIVLLVVGLLVLTIIVLSFLRHRM